MKKSGCLKNALRIWIAIAIVTVIFGMFVSWAPAVASVVFDKIGMSGDFGWILGLCGSCLTTLVIGICLWLLYKRLWGHKHHNEPEPAPEEPVLETEPALDEPVLETEPALDEPVLGPDPEPVRLVRRSSRRRKK